MCKDNRLQTTLLTLITTTLARKLAVLAGLSLALLVLVVASKAQHNLDISTNLVATNTSLTTVSVDTAIPLAAIPSRYMGLSFETSNLCRLVGLWDQDTLTKPDGTAVNVLEQLMKNLGPQTIRIGGVSADQNALWGYTGSYACVTGKTVITQQLVDQFYTFARRVNAKAVWTLNLGNYAPSTFSKEAAYVISKGAQVGSSNGSYLWGLAIGNEPDLYAKNGIKPSTYTVNNYISDWNIYKNAIRQTIGHPTFKFTGNDNAGNNSWFSTFMTNESSSLARVTRHFYPTSAGSTDPTWTATIDNLLSAATMQRAATTFDSWKSLSGSLPVALDETNSAAGGQAGVSDSFAAALWGLDYSFTALEHGISQINFHTGLSPTIYSPITNYSNNTWIARPLYYGMLAFHQAAPNGSVVKTSVSSPNNVVAHSVLDNSGVLHVVVINKDQTNPATVAIDTGRPYLSGSEMTMQASSAAATTGVTLGGSSVAADGSWTGQTQPLAVSNGSTTVSVAPSSAVIMTFTMTASSTQQAASGTTSATSNTSSTSSNTRQSTSSSQDASASVSVGQIPLTVAASVGQFVVTHSVQLLYPHKVSSFTATAPDSGEYMLVGTTTMLVLATALVAAVIFVIHVIRKRAAVIATNLLPLAPDPVTVSAFSKHIDIHERFSRYFRKRPR